MGGGAKDKELRDKETEESKKELRLETKAWEGVEAPGARSTAGPGGGRRASGWAGRPWLFH